jgi:hypothetical protein
MNKTNSLSTKDYYNHIRGLDARIPANAALDLAREAVELDRRAAERKTAPPTLVCVETLPDGSAPIRLSFSVKVF